MIFFHAVANIKNLLEDIGPLICAKLQLGAKSFGACPRRRGMRLGFHGRLVLETLQNATMTECV